jgi:hypothetical protein
LLLTPSAPRGHCRSAKLEWRTLVGIDHEFAADPERAVRVADTIEGPNPG